MKIVTLLNIQFLLLGADLPNLSQAQDVTVKFKNGYDKAITIDYETPTPSNGDYIGLYKGKNAITNPTDDFDLEMWLYTCNSQDCVGSSASGSITFDVTDPSAESGKQWPLPKGKYQACLGTETDGGDVVIKCKTIKVKRPPKKALTSLSLTMSADTYAVDVPIQATFSTNKPIRNSWVGVYRGTKPNSNKKKIAEPLMWVYLGCNNQAGDQVENNDCSKARKSGSIQIDEDSTDRSQEDWPLPAGTYHLCVSLNNNSPYKFFKCFDSFTIG